MPKLTYAYCTICGRRPSQGEEMNLGPVRYWDPDDGWRFGALCRWCYDEVKNDVPQPEDFAYEDTNGVIDDIQSDEDPTDLLMELGGV